MKAAAHKIFSSIDRAAWARFFLALIGLIVAFASAIFSTVFHNAGNIVVSAALASLALFLSGIIGITTVPYLARRVVIHRVRDAFDYDVTREGMGYLALILVIGVAALNTGNNLLFLVVAAMLAAIVVSGIASALLLRGAELEITLPTHVFAKRTVCAQFRLRNRRKLPAFSLNVVPPKRKKRREHWTWEHSVFVFPGNRPKGKEWLRMPDLALLRRTEAPAGPEIFTGAVYFPYIAGGSTAVADVELNFQKRGKYQQDAVGLATRFPFSFLVKTRRIALAREVLVYPSVEETDELMEILPMITGEYEVFVAGRGHDLYRIREYGPEDSARHLDWKASAKSQSLKVREFTREDERRLRIIFDNPEPGSVQEAAYERGVAVTASLAWHFAGENTQLSFVSQNYGGSRDVYDFLAHLALTQPARGKSLVDNVPLTDDFNIVLTTRTRGSIPTGLWSCSYFIFLDERPWIRSGEASHRQDAVLHRG
jgi:uncharacterized protein (DUF58 family)